MKVRIDADIEAIVPKFLSNRQQDILAVQTALNDEDYEAIRVIGHTMKGAGASYGFEFVSEIGKVLEVAATSHDRTAIAAAIEGLARYLEVVEVEFVEE